MTRDEQLNFLINYLSQEISPPLEIPQKGQWSQDLIFRALVNVRPPRPASQEFLQVQDAYLQAETRAKGITNLETLKPIQPNEAGKASLYLWQGDITTLKVDAIVNAANSQLLGCFVPNHTCIDNAIHTFSGVQLRLACNEIMQKQGHEEPTGQAKITPAFNLPCKYVLHTVGPIVQGNLTAQGSALLASCYRSCLDLAAQNGLKSLAFCCISTGVFGFPQAQAAEIAVRTVRDFLTSKSNSPKVIFNVYKEADFALYSRLLAAN